MDLTVMCQGQNRKAKAKAGLSTDFPSHLHFADVIRISGPSINEK